MLSKPVRLTVVYGLVWASVLSGILILWRASLEERQRQAVAASLASDWGTLKGYLRIERGRANWYFDKDDADEAAIISRLRSTFALADENGKLLELSPAVADLAPAAFQSMKPATSISHVRAIRNRRGARFLFYSGELRSEDGSRPYYAVLGRPILAAPSVWPLLLLAAGFSFAVTGSMIRQCRLQ